MPGRKPRPVGPYGKASSSRDPGSYPAEEDLGETALKEWTEVLLAATENPTEAVKKIDGGLSWALRDLLRTWNAHREKAERIELGVALSYLSGNENNHQEVAGAARRAPNRLSDYLLENSAEKTEEQKLEATRRKAEIDRRLSVNVVPNLIGKLAGRALVSLRDAQWMIAAVVLNWPTPLGDLSRSDQLTTDPSAARRFALTFLKALVLEKTGDMSDETRRELELDLVSPNQEPGTGEGLDRWVFPFVDLVETRDVRSLVTEAARGPGGLIIASSDKIFIEDDPVVSIRRFAELADFFAQSNETGLMIFIVDAGFLQANPNINRRRSLFNIHVLISALTSFAILGEKHAIDLDGNVLGENLERWQRFKERCCIILRGFSKIQSIKPDGSFEVAQGSDLDQAIRDECRLSNEEFENAPSFKMGTTIQQYHVLPNAFPEWVDARRAMTPKDLSANEFHLWNVLVDDQHTDDEPEINYYIVPRQAAPCDLAQTTGRRGGRGANRRNLTGGMEYLSRCEKPKAQKRISDDFDRAQRYAYRAARGRLQMDVNDAKAHDKNMRAVGDLRGAGFEVMPVEVAMKMLSDFP